MLYTSIRADRRYFCEIFANAKHMFIKKSYHNVQ